MTPAVCFYYLYPGARLVGAAGRRAAKGAVSGGGWPYLPKALWEDILCIFADLAGELPAPGKRYYVERFARTHVGMSTGWVSGDFWLDTAIPLLMERLEQMNCSKEYAP